MVKVDTYKLMGTCNISTQNGGGLQVQAALDAPVYYYHPDHLVLVGTPTRLCEPFDAPKSAVCGFGERRKDFRDPQRENERYHKMIQDEEL